MATIIQHQPTKKRYILIGSGYGRWAGVVGQHLFGSGRFTLSHGSQSLLAVSDVDGAILWLPSEETTVVSIDGKSPHSLLGEDGPYR